MSLHGSVIEKISNFHFLAVVSQQETQFFLLQMINPLHRLKPNT